MENKLVELFYLVAKYNSPTFETHMIWGGSTGHVRVDARVGKKEERRDANNFVGVVFLKSNEQPKKAIEDMIEDLVAFHAETIEKSKVVV